MSESGRKYIHNERRRPEPTRRSADAGTWILLGIVVGLLVLVITWTTDGPTQIGLLAALAVASNRRRRLAVEGGAMNTLRRLRQADLSG